MYRRKKKMVKRGGRRKKPEFFKVYLPERSSQQLCIPPAFIKHFNGTIPNQVTLKDCSGKVWHVNMEKIDSSLFIMNGWKCFVDDNSLELGEFLVFRYDGDSAFDVRLYGTDGCKKQQILDYEKTATSTGIKEEIEAEKTCFTTDQNCKINCSEIGHKRKRGFISLGSDSVTAKDFEAFDAGKLHIPKNPYFVASFNKKMHNYLSIPKVLVREHSIKLKPQMVLIDRNGNGKEKSWPVGVRCDLLGRFCFSRGWSHFRSDNKLYDSKCIFEFVCGRGGEVNKEVYVQIFHQSQKG